MKTANRAPKRPIEVKRGNVTVKIYTGANRAGGKEYPQFTLIYYSGGHICDAGLAALVAGRFDEF